MTRLRRACTDAKVPLRRAALEPGSPLANAVRAVTALPSATRLRGWAHDVLDDAPGDPADPIESAERRLAGAVLEFLRDQPLGDGAALRAWIAATDPFSTPGDTVGVELLTFHGAKGREWHTVVVTGVETGLVPHRSASTVAARAEEARLLHVARRRGRSTGSSSPGRPGGAATAASRARCSPGSTSRPRSTSAERWRPPPRDAARTARRTTRR